MRSFDFLSNIIDKRSIGKKTEGYKSHNQSIWSIGTKNKDGMFAQVSSPWRCEWKLFDKMLRRL